MTMELKDALELVLNTASDTANMFADGGLDAAHDEIKHAIRLLRDGSEKVEHKRDIHTLRCAECSTSYGMGKYYCDHCGSNLTMHGSFENSGILTESYTTHDEIKIIEVTSNPVFVEIGEME